MDSAVADVLTVKKLCGFVRSEWADEVDVFTAFACVLVCVIVVH